MRPKFPALKFSHLRERVSFFIPESALQRWNPSLAAKDGGEDASISIFDVIGEMWDGSGVTVNRIAAALRSIGPKKTVAVYINSPGGDLFEGAAIYNLLRDYDGTIIVRVIGIAASAASVIAMAGEKIQVARFSFMMIHNCWVIALGNRNELRAVADWLEPFDDAAADVYAARTAKEKKEVGKMMDKETWLSGSQAVEGGFADELLPADQVQEKDDEAAAARRSMRVALMSRGGVVELRQQHARDELAQSLRVSESEVGYMERCRFIFNPEFIASAQRRLRPAPNGKQDAMEVRTFTMDSVKVEKRDEGYRITGHAAPFEKWSEDLGGFREKVARGAFAKALKKDDVRALFNHDENFVLGRNTAGTLVLAEDELGLRCEIDAPDVQWVRDLAVSMERGDIDQMSFAFRVGREGQEWRKASDGTWERTVHDVERLYDVSIVTFPAYPQTDAAVRDLRSALAEHQGHEEAQRQSEELDAARKAQAQRLAEIDL